MDLDVDLDVGEWGDGTGCEDATDRDPGGVRCTPVYGSSLCAARGRRPERDKAMKHLFTRLIVALLAAFCLGSLAHAEILIGCRVR
jgi:hypothetical protein